tara:strand:- start:1576 stop:2913 length:1338 start_codon:yes stop_codon:yes gene_type:complete
MLLEILNNELYELLKKDDFKKEFSIQLGYSGGLDSSCLLDALIKCKKDNNLKLFVTYVNYNTSSYSTKVLDNLKKIPNDVVVSVFDAQIDKSSNFESSARELRYSFFDKIKKKYNIDYTFTAHHFNDQIETLLMKFIDGSDPIGMQGIRKKVGKIYRPILKVTRENLIEYSKNNNIKYLEDPTNQDISFRRNKVRKIAIPILYKDSFLMNQLLQINKKSIKKVSKIKKDINKTIADLNLCQQKEIDFLAINIKTFKKKDVSFIKLFFNSILSKVFHEETKQKRHIFWLEVINFISFYKIGSILALSDNVNLLKDREDFYIYKKNILKQNNQRRFKFQKSYFSYLGNIDLIESNENNSFASDEYIINREIFNEGIFIRYWRSGDKVSFNYGTKKVSDLFIDKKIPIIKKKLYPIVEDSNRDIIWIPKIYRKKMNKTGDKIMLRWSD